MENAESKTNDELQSKNWLFKENENASKTDNSGFKFSLGTKTKIYKITSCEELQNIAHNLNANYELIQDIDCSNTRNWNNGMGFMPIGDTAENSFKGTFNGNKYNVSGLYINRPNMDRVGLFGEINSHSSEISNVGLNDIDITGHGMVGGLVGLNKYGIILNTYANGKIHGNKNDVGGLIGQNFGIISNSYSLGSVSGNSNVGGLVGLNCKTIANSYSMSSVTSTRGNIVGGLVGFSDQNGKTFNSYWNTEASHQSASAGGIGKSPAEMKQLATYEGWNFNEIWQMKDSTSHPTLRKNPFIINISRVPSPQIVQTPITITLYANDAGFNGRIILDCARGRISPSYIDMVNGAWTGDILLYTLGKDNHLAVRWLSNDDICGGTSISNTFHVVDENNKIPKNATIIGKVTDDFKNPIANAKVKLYSEDPKYNDVLTSTSTDSGGNYKFQNLLSEQFFLRIEKPGFQVSSQTIETATNMTITGNAVLHRSCNFGKKKKDLVPVLLIPGILGSKSEGYIYPFLPKITPKWNEDKLKIHDPGLGGWSFVGWTQMKTELKKYGYVEDCTLFEVPYDWSLSIENIRDQFLIPWIKHAKGTKNKVDIIAHSMGGLVARSYIQSHQYAGDVRKFAMLGTPNKGSANAYYMWEGGDTMEADERGDNMYYLYVFTNTLFYLYRDRYSKNICTFKWGLIPEKCNVTETYKFAHKSVHSLGQLMPIYDRALIDYQTYKTILVKNEENTFLKALNNLNCLNTNGCRNFCGQVYAFKSPSEVFSKTQSESKVETKLFVGAYKSTLHYIRVKPRSSSYSGILYKDGEPKLDPVYSTFGDGTALEDSVIFNDYFPKGQGLNVSASKFDHAKLVKEFVEEIAEFIRDKPLSDSDPKHSPIKTFVFRSESKAESKLSKASDKKSPNEILVRPRSSNYKKGQYKLNHIYSFLGNETILNDTSMFNNSLSQGQGLNVGKESSQHLDLNKKVPKTVPEFNMDEQTSFLDEKDSITREPVLVISIKGRIQPVITEPTNIKISGKDLELDYASLEINNLVDGKYTVSLLSSYNEDFEITITYVDAAQKIFFENRLRGYYDNTLTKFTFSLNRKSINDTIQFDRTFGTPVDLQMHSGRDNQMQLTWQDPTAALYQDVEYYSIFWKPNFDAYFKFLAQVVNEKNYQTNHSWLNALENTYVVKAKLKDSNRSTFFSPPTWMDGYVSSSAASLNNPFSMIASTVRSCINNVLTLFTPSEAKNKVLEEIDSIDLTQINVTPVYGAVTNDKDISSLSVETHDFISFSNEGKHPFMDQMPMISQTLFENFHANIMLGHVTLHWINSFFHWIPEKILNSETKKANKRLLYSGSTDNFRLQLNVLKEILQEKEKQVEWLLKVVGENSITWIFWGIEDYKSDIEKLEDKLKNGELNLEEVLELIEDINYFTDKVDKKVKQAVQMPNCCNKNNHHSTGKDYEKQIPYSKIFFTEKHLQGVTNRRLLPDFPRAILPFNVNTNSFAVNDFGKIM